jgi:hypothetical protein
MKRHRFLRQDRVAPRVEELESRLTPTPGLTLTHVLNSLTIHAVGSQNFSPHTVHIFDDGAGDLSVQVDGVTTGFTGINSITLSGGKLVDVMTYTLTGNLKQGQSLAVQMNPVDQFNAILRGSIGDAATGTNGNLNIQVNDSPGNDVAGLSVAGDVLSGSTLTYANNFGVGGGVANSVGVVNVLGTIAGVATFDFTTGQNPFIPNKESLLFNQFGNISGTETVKVHGITRKFGFINDTFRYTGQLTGTLTVEELAGSNPFFRATNHLFEQFILQNGSTGSLFALENNQPRSLGTETLTVFKSGTVTASVVGAIDAAFGSAPITNDPFEVVTHFTP